MISGGIICLSVDQLQQPAYTGIGLFAVAAGCLWTCASSTVLFRRQKKCNYLKILAKKESSAELNKTPITQVIQDPLLRRAMTDVTYRCCDEFRSHRLQHTPAQHQMSVTTARRCAYTALSPSCTGKVVLRPQRGASG